MVTAIAPSRTQVDLPRPHESQQSVISEAKRFNVLCCGRRFGKTALGIDRLTFGAWRGDPVAWFSPTYKMLTEVWRTLCDTLYAVTVRKSEQEHRLAILGGGTIDMWSLDSADTTRGRAYKRVIVDEAAQVAGLQDAWESVIRPTLTDYRGDAWFLSTPRGFNYFKVLYERGQDPVQQSWRSWTFPTSANPYIAPDEIEAARRELPEQTFAQEYLAAFVSDQSGVFRRLLEAAVLEPQAPIAGHSYIVGCDWGKMDDYSVFSVVDATARQQVWIDRSNRIDYTLQVGRLRALCERYRPAAVIAEANAMGQAIIEQVRAARLPVVSWTASQGTKQQMIEALSLAFEQDAIKILRDPVQLAELQAYESTRTASGLMRYAAPEGMHDDTVMALGLAWLGARQTERPRMREFAVVEG